MRFAKREGELNVAAKLVVVKPNALALHGAKHFAIFLYWWWYWGTGTGTVTGTGIGTGAGTGTGIGTRRGHSRWRWRWHWRWRRHWRWRGIVTSPAAERWPVQRKHDVKEQRHLAQTVM